MVTLPLYRLLLRLCVAIALMIVVAPALGCASYTDRIQNARQALVDGQTEQAIAVINEELDVDSLDGLPDDLDDQRALLLLERATLLQALGHYESAARDMIIADDRMEWIDIQSAAPETIMRFVYSDDAGDYRAPPHERLMLNTLNMVNFLALGDYSGARVEARRFNLLQDYFLDEQSRRLMPALLGLGNYLAGVSFEASGDYREAVRYYMLAHIHGIWPESNDHRLLDLIRLTGYTGSGLGELGPRADAALERARHRRAINRSQYHKQWRRGDTLAVIQTGLVPYRQARRIPINQALTYANRSPYASRHLHAGHRQQALTLYSAGALTWLNVAELSHEGLPAPAPTVAMQTGDRVLRLTHPIELSAQIEAAWQIVAGTALAAGISRAVVRAVAGEATRQAAQAVAEQSEASAFAWLIGWLSGAAVQASMSAADTPDTRSWTTLPAEIHLVRMSLEPGPQSVDVQVGADTDRRDVDIAADTLTVLNYSRFR